MMCKKERIAPCCSYWFPSCSCDKKTLNSLKEKGLLQGCGPPAAAGAESDSLHCQEAGCDRLMQMLTGYRSTVPCSGNASTNGGLPTSPKVIKT